MKSYIKIFEVVLFHLVLVSSTFAQTKLEHGLHIYRTIKGSQLAVLPNTTHHTFEEKPALISNLIIDFLGK